MNLHDIMETLNQYGPPGIFLAAFISNLIPGFPAIYLAFIATYAAVVDNPVGGVLAVVAAGVGAGLGKVVVFLASRALTGASERLRRKREEARVVLEKARSQILLLVFLFAALPLPDDVLYIPLGAAGYRMLYFALAVIAGKTVQTAMIYAMGRAYKAVAGNLASSPIFYAGMFIGALVITYIVFSIDWKGVYEEYEVRGKKRATIRFLQELLRVLTLGAYKPPYARRR